MQSFQESPDSNESLWLLLAIIFIVLFVISFAANIFLWIVRRRDIIKLQEDMQQKFNAQLRESQTNVFYGGTKSTYL